MGDCPIPLSRLAAAYEEALQLVKEGKVPCRTLRCAGGWRAEVGGSGVLGEGPGYTETGGDKSVPLIHQMTARPCSH